jgi:hypothetical protein
VPVDGGLVAELDRPRDERHAEVVGCDVVDDADGDSGRHTVSMTHRRERSGRGGPVRVPSMLLAF